LEGTIVDKHEALPDLPEQAKSGWRVSVTQALDSMAPPFVPVARRWQAEAERRNALRTPANLKALNEALETSTAARTKAEQARARRQAARAASKNPFGASRRSAAASERAAQQERKAAKAKLRTARRNYPATLLRRAVQVHTAHAAPTTAATAVTAWQGDPLVWPASVSAGLIGLNALALLLGGRGLTPTEPDDGMSAEERQLMERLAPVYWVEHAPARGLAGTITTPPQVTPGGIVCEVRLDGTWTVKGLRDRLDSVRALLGARTALRIRVTSGTRGGWAVLTFGTRRATDGTSSLWTPDRIPADTGLMSLGLDVETGEEVLVPFDERLLISGASGTGKSWSTRPLMATAHLRGDLLFIDGKGEEANTWESVCRCAVEPDEIADGIDEAHHEMTRRKHDMKRRGISVWDGPQLTVVIDEGQVVLAAVKRDKDRLQRLVELSSLGRSRGVVLWWATQYPVTDGGAPGVHQLIAPNLLTRFSLRVAGTTQAQVALDDCAHYAPHQIPEGREWRGHGYLKGYGPRMIRTWTLDDIGVRALPARHWQTVAPQEAPGGPVLRLVKDGVPLETAVPAQEAPATQAGTATNRERVFAAVRDGARTAKEVTLATGLNKGTVSRELKQLVDAGEIVRADDGTLSLPAAGEVSA
jgi:hypothetical protein